LAADKTIGRSEALRRSMVALIEQGKPHEAHPTYWAPFVVVGEGGVGEIAPKPLATSSIIPESQPPTKASPSATRPRPSKRITPDWRSEVWRLYRPAKSDGRLEMRVEHQLPKLNIFIYFQYVMTF
jgi:hypothetical protein